jgi:hypothetical protein
MDGNCVQTPLVATVQRTRWRLRPMEPDRAIEIVQSLADGVDPYTDERFPSSSPYQQADTVRALHLAIEGLTKLRRSTARSITARMGSDQRQSSKGKRHPAAFQPSPPIPGPEIIRRLRRFSQIEKPVTHLWNNLRPSA